MKYCTAVGDLQANVDLAAAFARLDPHGAVPASMLRTRGVAEALLRAAVVLRMPKSRQGPWATLALMLPPPHELAASRGRRLGGGGTAGAVGAAAALDRILGDAPRLWRKHGRVASGLRQ